ncbi:calcium and integrin-binding protein 1-like [Callorhinchus milii]|uniref:calcium and integrin-binding protein 1-like n=1 Tax=Callorhinchus milii TaxID=7868 RepID=UPI001C3F96DC|nr:calcium and integrin-binding protein 1-like [Callorhinchus milii]
METRSIIVNSKQCLAKECVWEEIEFVDNWVAFRKHALLVEANLFDHKIACKRFQELVPENVENFTRSNVRAPMEQMIQISELKANPFKERICKIFSTSKTKNGSISFEDFLDIFSAFSKSAPVSVKADYAFKIMDFNGNGVLDRQDVVKSITCMTGNDVHNILTDLEMTMIIDMIIEETDMDGDGHINLGEFHHIVSKMPDFPRYYEILRL